MPEEIPTPELQRMPRDMFGEMARYLSPADLSALMQTSSGMNEKVGEYIDKIVLSGDIVNSSGIPVDRTASWRKIVANLEQGDYQRSPGQDPITSILDVLRSQEDHDQTEKFAQYVVICTFWLERAANEFKSYALDALERVNYTFAWLEEGRYLRTEDGGVISRPNGQTVLDMAREWRATAGTLAPLPV